MFPGKVEFDLIMKDGTFSKNLNIRMETWGG